MNIHPVIQDYFASFAEDTRGVAEARIEALRAFLSQCESPLEQKFIMEFLLLDGYSANIWTESGRTYIAIDNQYDGFIKIFAQYPVSVEGRKMRLDFFFAYVTRGNPPIVNLKLAVEIDGHDYHERTPAQAERDRSRDRLLYRAGYTVLRFTGREVYRDITAGSAPDEVFQVLRNAEVAIAKQKGVYY